MSEINGRHQLVAVYPGCYIGHARTVDPADSPAIDIYQIVGFVRSESGYQAKCRRVLQTVSNLDPDRQQLFGLLLAVCRQVAMSQRARGIIWREE